MKHNLFSAEDADNAGVTCEKTEAQLLAMTMGKIQHECDGECAFTQQCSCHKGTKIFGEKGKQAAAKESKQQHARTCFSPMAVEALSKVERDRAQQVLMCLAEKRDGTIKGRMVCNGKPMREWLNEEDSASPMVTMEGPFITMMTDAHKK